MYPCGPDARRGEATTGLTELHGVVRTARAAPPFLLHTIGVLRATDGAGATVALPRGRKACALLALLALAPRRTLSRERLMRLLWSTRGEPQARASLRQVLTEIRKLPIGVPEIILMSRRDVSLADGAIETDLDRAMAAADAGDLPALAATLCSMDGAILEDYDGIDPGFDQWLVAERKRLPRQLVERSRDLAMVPAPAELLSIRRALVEALQRLDGQDESLVRLGLALDEESSDSAAVHGRYRRLETRLRDDGAPGPSFDTRQLFRRLTSVGSVASFSAEPLVTAAAPPIRRAVEPPILVISPLTVIGDDAEAALIAAVYRDDLEVALGGFSDLRVLSLEQPSPGALDVACSGSIASYVLSGTVRRVAGGFRLNLRLVAISSALLVWSQQVSLEQHELGAALDDIVARIAGAMLPVVERDLGRSLPSEADAHGYTLYLKARMQLLTATSLTDIGSAAELLEAAVVQDGSLTNARLWLARLYNTDFEQRIAGHDVRPLRDRAFALCAEAAARDPGNPHVHSRLGWCHLRRGELRQAEQRFERALALAPYHADRIEEVAFGLVHLGLAERGRGLIQRAFELNPFPPGDYFLDLAVTLMLCGDHAAAAEQFETVRGGAFHYRVIRLANLALLRGEALPLLAEEVRAAFAPIWQRRAPATDDDLATALLEFLPLQLDADRALLRSGLRIAGFAL